MPLAIWAGHCAQLATLTTVLHRLRIVHPKFLSKLVEFCPIDELVSPRSDVLVIHFARWKLSSFVGNVSLYDRSSFVERLEINLIARYESRR